MIDDARDDRETAEAPDTTRRRLLTTAASGFALAASGLLLPAWLVEEAAADNHPVRHVQHRADKRRQRKHHRLKQKRRQQQHQPGAPDAPGAFIKGVRLKVVATYGPLGVLFRYGTFVWHDGKSVTITRGGSDSYATGDLNVGALFVGPTPAEGLLFAWASNPVGTPDVTVQQGQKTLIGHRNMPERSEIPLQAFLYDGLRVNLLFTRERDSDDYKEFTLTVSPLS